MAKIPPHIVDDIMQTARIEEVIGEFVQLKRAGSNLKGLSPFTDEKTASFVVSPAKQIFKCFSSGKGGSVVTFLMEKEHYSYPEALKWLADKYGIELPEERPATPEELQVISERESLYIINDFARDHFSSNLSETDEGKKIGLSYFEERGYKPEIIELFQLGYCLNKSNGFTKAALDKKYKLEYLEKVGLTKVKEDRSFDFFRGRVMFPIHSVSGRVLGFGGRTLLADKKIAKYFNSPESLIYNKSEILYGLYFAKGDIIKYDQCYLCEGYTDVISMYQAGVKNVVSSSGTSLTKEQIRLIKRYTKNITILFDGDAAGIKASFRGIDLILEEGLNVSVVLFPDGEDPDSYSKSVSTAELEEFISNNRQDFISFKSSVLLADGGDDPIKKAGLIKEIVQSVALIPDSITRNVYIQSVAEQFEMNEQVITGELIKLRKDHVAKEKRHEAPRGVDKTPAVGKKEVSVNDKQQQENFHNAEFDLMRILVQYGASAITLDSLDEQGEKVEIETSVSEYICHELNEDELVFTHPTFNKMHELITEALSESSLLKSSYFKRLEDQEIVKFITEIELNEHELSHNWVEKYGIHTSAEVDKLKETVPKSVYNFKLSKINKRIQELSLQKMEENVSEEDFMLILGEERSLLEVRLQFHKLIGRV